MSKIDIKDAISNPSQYFKHPQDVLATSLSQEDKIKILQSWEYDLRDLAVAEEENMAKGESSNADLLSTIHKILDDLNALDDSSNTKQ